MIDVVFFRLDGSIVQVGTLLNAAEADATVETRADVAGWIAGKVDPARWRVDNPLADAVLVELPPPEPPPAPTAAELLAAERARMRAYRLAWHDAAAMLPYGPGTLFDAINALLSQLPAPLVRRYGDVTIFERLRPEVAGFLMNPAAIDLPPAAVDALFRLAMALEAQRMDDVPGHVAAWTAALA